MLPDAIGRHRAGSWEGTPMTSVVAAGPPLESTVGSVGHARARIVDPSRADRTLVVDCWYPAVNSARALTVYELLPGIGVTAAAHEEAPATPGPHPLLVWSHGRSGTTTTYVMLCEGLAARGYVVVAPEHPGDTLLDWLTATAVDDATNEHQRVADAQLVLDRLLGDRDNDLAVVPAVDAAKVAVAGHSYGAFTAFALAAAEADRDRICGAAGLESLTRTIPAQALRQITVPILMVTGAFDDVTPVATDADPAWVTLADHVVHRVDLDHAGHQGCSDVGLYLELIDQVDDVPEVVRDFVQGMATQVTGRADEPWRPTVTLHLCVLAAWLDLVTGRDSDQACAELAHLGSVPGVLLRQTDAESGC